MKTKHTYKQIIIIPDVHGREFWKPIVEKHKNSKDTLIVFLGDYLDPYTTIDGISESEAVINFIDIINEAASADNIITLLGNHDLHYFPQLLYSTYGCRRIESAKHEICKIFDDNIDLFRVAYETRINGRKYLFTHAGVLPGWLNWLTTLDEENKPFDCKIWPVRVMNNNGKKVLAVAKLCPNFKDDKSKLINLINEELEEKIKDYIAKNPYLINDLKEDYQVIKEL